MLAVIQLGLGRISFRRLRRLLTRSPRARHQAAVSPGFMDSVSWAVTAASRRMPGAPMCLSQALAVQVMLARRGFASRLRVGVARGGLGQVEGHAWVEHEGRVLIGGAAMRVDSFTPILALHGDR